MPSPYEYVEIAGTKYDRRIKLSEEDKEEIRRVAPKIRSVQQLAELYEVNVSTIYRILHPAQYDKMLQSNKVRFKERKRQYKGSSAELLADKRERRNYKKKLVNAGKVPFNSEKVLIAGTQYDRRLKLTEAQRAEIQELYLTGTISQRRLAQQFCVSRTLIRCIVDKDFKEQSRERLKMRRADGRYKQPKEIHASVIREHRRYKQNLIVNGKIKKNESS